MQVAKVTSFNSLLGTSGAGVAIQVKQAQVTHGVYAAVGALDDPEMPKTACRRPVLMPISFVMVSRSRRNSLALRKIFALKAPARPRSPGPFDRARPRA